MIIKSLLGNTYMQCVSIYRKIFGYPRVYDALSGKGKHSKRALLVYLVRPFLVDPQEKSQFRQHQNWWQNLEIARILDSMEYIVDVVHFQDFRFKPQYNYDLLIGMGLICGRLSKFMSEKIPKIYIATGAETSFNNKQEMNRIAEVASRRGCHLKPRRIAKFNSIEFKYFDAIACFGNEFTAKTFRQFHNRIYRFNNIGYSDIPYFKKNFDQAKYNFLYFAGPGQVHKGLDLLLELFPLNPEFHLYICGPFKKEFDFVRCYYKELFETPNIHPVGYVKVPERNFKDVCKKCAYIIMPSCAEANAGAVVICMHAGLIPIVSKECGIDTNDFGITLQSCDIDEITNTVKHVANLPAEWHEDKSIKTRKVSVELFSKDSFSKRWREIFHQILQQQLPF